MGQPPKLAIHSKACVCALGTEKGAEVIASAGYSSVVWWLGESGEFMGSIASARARGLCVEALAFPKRPAWELVTRGPLRRLLETARAEIDTPVSLIFEDQVGREEMDLRVLAFALSDVAPLRIENNGSSAERFADLRVIAALAALVPGLGVALDLGHLASSGQGMRSTGTIAELWSRVVEVQVHDNDGKEDLHLPLGEGVGEGAFGVGWALLPRRPSCVLVETDMRLGRDVEAWKKALTQERRRLARFLERTPKGRRVVAQL